MQTKKYLLQSHKLLQRQILLLTLSFTLFISLLVSVLTIYFYRNYLKSTMLRSTDSHMQYLVDSMDQNIEEVNRFIHFSQSNTTIGSFVESVSTYKGVLSIKAYDRLNEEYLSNAASSYMQRIIISNSSGSYLQVVNSAYSTSQDVAAQTKKMPYYENFVKNTEMDFSTGFIPDPYHSSYSEQILPVILPITYRYNSTHGGFIAISLSENIFTDPLSYYGLDDNSRLFLTLGTHNYELTPDGLVETTNTDYNTKQLFQYELSANTSAYQISSSDGNSDLLAVTKPLSVSGCYVTQVSSFSALSSVLYLYLISIALIIGMIILLGMLLTYSFYRMIALPIVKLQSRMERISAGDFARDPSVEWEHELGDVGRGINDLAENVLTLMDARVEDARQKKDLEYKMLQTQVNPHFLYNTLNSIKWMATIQGSEGISNMTTSLSRLLKSVSKGTKLLIPLSEELALSQDYFTIQQYRYGGTIQMSVEVCDEALYNCAIIKFTLQPLIENAIFHGIEPKGAAGQILIKVHFLTAQLVEIIVEDDGVGMEPEQIQALLSGEEKDGSEFFREIGISNVHKRLQYEFGEEYGISIESEKNSYTRMILHIPYTTLS